MAREIRPVLLTKAFVGLDGKKPVRGFQIQQVAGHLPDTGADLNHVAFEIRGKFADQRLPVIARLIEGGKLEVVRIGKGVGGGWFDKTRGGR